MRKLEGHSFTLIFVNILAIVERKAIYVKSPSAAPRKWCQVSRDKKGPSK